ncbi:MAG: leucyl aminopeptidase family protein [Proteobacteria bacterium]|nr:leucyl aminopeptidase family protein [Pseudomonadota bacterium]
MSEQYLNTYFTKEGITERDAVLIHILNETGLDDWLTGQTPSVQHWVEQQQYSAAPGKHLLIPAADGRIACVLLGRHPQAGLCLLQDLPNVLPAGDYQLSSQNDAEVYLGWGLASYEFSRYKEAKADSARLQVPTGLSSEVRALLSASCRVRDLVNTPTQDMGPEHLAGEVEQVAQRLGAEFESIIGDELLDHNYPAIHAVGRAATTSRAPRLLRLTWGNSDDPLLILVGKGVCFDTGGLDIKPANGMLKMKKDMGGAAHALALSELVMSAKLPVRLELLIPAVENAISADAYRPGDVVHTRKGITVEIGNTDAEGRMVLADALAYACEQSPDLVIDFATLTGAARVALGPDLPPLFSNNDAFQSSIHANGDRLQDPLWPMPLYQPYTASLKSKIADINNVTTGLMGAGAITAALFLQKFVEPECPWVHIDTYAWNDSDRPGRPAGGEAMGLRAVFASLQQRYPVIQD